MFVYLSPTFSVCHKTKWDYYWSFYETWVRLTQLVLSVVSKSSHRFARVLGIMRKLNGSLTCNYCLVHDSIPCQTGMHQTYPYPSIYTSIYTHASTHITAHTQHSISFAHRMQNATTGSVSLLHYTCNYDIYITL